MGEERAKKLQERLNQKRLEREAQEKKGRPGSQPNERRLETAGDAEASGAEETGEAGRQAGQRASEEADRTGPPREEGRATEGGRSQEVPGECHDDGHLTERNPAGSIQTWSNRNQNTDSVYRRYEVSSDVQGERAVISSETLHNAEQERPT